MGSIFSPIGFMKKLDVVSRNMPSVFAIYFYIEVLGKDTVSIIEAWFCMNQCYVSFQLLAKDT